VKEQATENTEHTSLNTTFEDHYIAAIGASAGGLEAIHAFFDHVTDTANLSFIIIQHLSPDYKSLLVDLVAKHTHMEVFEAEEDIEVKRSCIYVIPPGKLMTISEGKLKLSEKKEGDKGPNTAIDTFLYTLAEDIGEKALAIILSGTGSDGTKGAEAVKNAGGLVFVQDPETARFDGMPRSAAAIADFILSPSQMPAEIAQHIQEIPTSIFSDGKIDNSLLGEIFRLIYKHTGCNFHYYKLPTLLRRLSRRMMQHQFKLINDYIGFLQTNPEECKLLCKDFLIGVTRFFRDPQAFDALNEKAINRLIDEKADGDSLKVWVCACSTGEEAYTMAMLINECLERKDKKLSVKIFATDIDTQALEKAAKGCYPSTISKDIPAAFLEKYFIREGRKYCVIPELRKQIVFAKHNIINDPPFIKNDLVSCRNMLIYMNTVLQKKVLHTLSFSLHQGGFLFLGSSETIAPFGEGLQEIDRKWKLFRKESATNPRFSSPLLKNDLQYFKVNKSPASEYTKDSFQSLTEEMRQALTEDFGYAAIYIDRNYELKDATGDFRRYLSLPEHSLELNLLKMVPIDLATSLGTAIRKAWKDSVKVVMRNVRVKDPQHQRNRSVNIMVKAAKRESNNPYTLIVFGENEATPMLPTRFQSEESGDKEQDVYINELKTELRETRLNLQLAIEGLETANEELQSTNEELLSSNEELQSSNEELQSLNEELHTLNTEHQIKINELVELNDDLNNFFSSIDIGQVFLDSSLRIRRFNPSAVRLINLIEADIGRPFSNISTNIANENLTEAIETVIRTGQVLEKEILLNDNRASLMRIFPYVRQDKRIDGIVLTFVDITAMKTLNNIISGIFNASQNGIMALKAVRDSHNKIIDFVYLAANTATETLYKRKKEAFIGKRLLSVFPGVKEKGLFDKYVKVVEQDLNLRFEYPVKCNEKNGWWEISAVKMGDGIAVTITDISAKRESEEMLRANYNELIRAREELKKLNAELEQKVKERTEKLSISEERFRLVSRATNDAIWDWDLVTNSLWISDSYFSMFGYPQEEHLKRSYWSEKIHPDDREQVMRSISQAINTNSKQWSAEYRYLKQNGEYAFILDRGYIMHDEYGTPYRMLSSMLDVTQLRKAERDYVESLEQRRFLAESMPLMVWTASPAGKVKFINQHFAIYAGLPSQSSKVSWGKLIDAEHLDIFQSVWKDSILKAHDFSLELKLRRHDGEYRWHLLRARAKKDEAGKLIMWVGTNTDIHEQKLATEIMEQKVAERTAELQNINRQLELSNHDLQQFASVASHDLKEPLRKIHMFSKMLKDRYLSDVDGATEYIDRIIASSLRMTRLINDLLNFSRLSVDSYFEKVEINAVIDEVLADLELAIQEKKARIIVDRFPALEAVPGQIRQVFQNIISNALKFSKADEPPLIRIEGERVKEKHFDGPASENGNYLRIRIQDNGIGFDDQFRDKIFTIFQRLHTRQQYDGTGIGLAICKKIIEKHNGLITAQGRENEGTVFTILLPLRQNR